MRRFFILLYGLFLVHSMHLQAQQPPALEKKGLQVVDSLSPKEKAGRNVLLLRSELDSMIKQYNDSIALLLPVQPVQDTAKAETDYELIIVVLSLLVIGLLLYMLLRNQQKFKRIIESLNREVRELQFAVQQQDSDKAGSPPPAMAKGRQSQQATEKKLQLLTANYEKLVAENQQLQQSFQGNKLLAADYESVKQLMAQVYKMRNYPGYSKDKSETEIVKGVMETERSIALYAYEHFVKPVIAVADAHKNDPARITAEKQQEIVDNLVSLGLLYSEYLYLRIGELTVGGKIIERIGGIRQHQQPDMSALKELNTEHGSRALVLRMALEKIGINRLSYPVFDETNLNLS